VGLKIKISQHIWDEVTGFVLASSALHLSKNNYYKQNKQPCCHKEAAQCPQNSNFLGELRKKHNFRNMVL